jgi:hypothetical protein
MEKAGCSEMSEQKIKKCRLWGITQKKEYNIYSLFVSHIDFEQGKFTQILF